MACGIPLSSNVGVSKKRLNYRVKLRIGNQTITHCTYLCKISLDKSSSHGVHGTLENPTRENTN